jgi:hypothetical protein
LGDYGFDLGIDGADGFVFTYLQAYQVVFIKYLQVFYVKHTSVVVF